LPPVSGEGIAWKRSVRKKRPSYTCGILG